MACAISSAWPARAALGRATPREMGALRDSILRLPDVAGAVGGFEAREAVHAARSDGRTTSILLTDIGEDLSQALVEQPPAQLDDGDRSSRDTTWVSTI